ncbi:hypothetical protein CGZ94_17360 [Enemella evansiae]|uniref:DUF624 domain-containing protein n=1 Tax=Enemella evansiae TaxID=2016499 RepID=A0A255G4A2_9ACTN|nr:DUF624 domain-containing protein [Enemella evansiae]OYO10740.1 hypothetical protein CGZ94_17360 [Enemella evansiae]
MSRSSTSTPPRILPELGQGAYESIFGHVYAFLAVNLMLAVANLPLLLFAFAAVDPTTAWPIAAVLALTAAPSITGAMGVFQALKHGSTTPVRDFWQSWARHLTRATVIGIATLAVVGICVADLRFLAGSAAGALTTPLFCVIALTALATGFTALVVAALHPGLGLRQLVLMALYLSVRYWPVALVNIVCLAAVSAAVLAQPVIGALLAPSILLFVAWSNTHFVLVRTARRSAVDPGGQPSTASSREPYQT